MHNRYSFTSSALVSIGLAAVTGLANTSCTSENQANPGPVGTSSTDPAASTVTPPPATVTNTTSTTVAPAPVTPGSVTPNPVTPNPVTPVTPNPVTPPTGGTGPTEPAPTTANTSSDPTTSASTSTNPTTGDTASSGETAVSETSAEDTGTGSSEGYPEFKGADCEVTAGTYGTDNTKLPNPFQMNDGSVISSMAQWECRRAEIIKDLEEYEVGPKPAPPEVTATYNNGALSVQVTTPSGSITLTSNISGSGNCVIIGTAGNNLVTGCKTMAFSHDQVVKNDHSSGDAWPTDPYYKVYPDLYEEAPYGGDPIENGNLLIGNYSAWSWGVSRLIDGLELTKEQHGIDLSKIGVQGCSYGGKMALWAGALDQRIALTIAQESGGGGAPAWRSSEDWEQGGGGDVESIDDTNWAWFKDSLLNSREPHKLPHDHHELIALIAPRAVVSLSGDPGNAWLGAQSEYISFMAAQQVWKAMGVQDHAGLQVHSQGGQHCSASNDQKTAAQAFVNRFLLGQSVDTNIVRGTGDDWESMVDWTAPTLAQ